MTSVSFRAVVESARGGGHVVEMDPEVARKLGAKHRTRVRGTLDGAEYRSNLISRGERLVLGVHKATLRTAGRDTGDSVRVTMAIDAEPLPNDEVPEILARALEENARARGAWESLPPSHRRRYVGLITEAKRDETRARRAEDAMRQMIEAEERRRG
jgi:MoaA/NifB/PqqE/SkfB family radical SAM enzyme